MKDLMDQQTTLDALTPRYAELKGRVAVITGAAKGIGQGIAVRLAAEGMRIVAPDRDEDALMVTADMLRKHGGDVLPIHTDLSESHSIDRLFDDALEAFGAVDLLVNNAADLHRKYFLDEHDDLLDVQLATNIRSPYLCSQRAAKIMQEAGGGNIVHISSVGARRAHHRGFPYDVTKGAINAMTQAMAIELGRYGIRVNAIGPGLTHTYLTDELTDPASYREAARSVPLGRYGTPSDIAAMVAFLASSEARYVTGQVIYVDGGMTAQLGPPVRRAIEGDDSGDQAERTDRS
jgi:3-oxoacyl-[acyl-carrier protein] reductase